MRSPGSARANRVTPYLMLGTRRSGSERTFRPVHQLFVVEVMHKPTFPMSMPALASPQWQTSRAEIALRSR